MAYIKVLVWRQNVVIPVLKHAFLKLIRLSTVLLHLSVFRLYLWALAPSVGQRKTSIKTESHRWIWIWSTPTDQALSQWNLHVWTYWSLYRQTQYIKEKVPVMSCIYCALCFFVIIRNVQFKWKKKKKSVHFSTPQIQIMGVVLQYMENILGYHKPLSPWFVYGLKWKNQLKPVYLYVLLFLLSFDLK